MIFKSGSMCYLIEIGPVLYLTSPSFSDFSTIGLLFTQTQGVSHHQ
jgi:hypothetical protein